MPDARSRHWSKGRYPAQLTRDLAELDASSKKEIEEDLPALQIMVQSQVGLVVA
jgi:hypothetical protein